VKVGKEHKMLKLKKTLYELKQAPRAWNTQIDAYFKKYGFVQCSYEHELYLKIQKMTFYLWPFIYMIWFLWEIIEIWLRSLSWNDKRFEMTDLGLMSYILSLEVRQEIFETFVSQETYAKEIL
jgi:Reverse transcriptase (RNA-dependent DNA polymerase)